MLPRLIETSKDGAEAVLVPGGDFKFGINEAEIERILGRLGQSKEPLFGTEKPRSTVTIKDCYIDRHPVTNRRYGRFMKETKHPAPLFWNDPRWNKPEQPVVGVSYLDALAYARWAGKRLPTEEEWERAARGTDERAWPWGNDFVPQYCNSKELGAGRTNEVGKFPHGASPVGALDMSGNVWEFTSGDWEGFGKCIRGGSYSNPAAYCRTTCRWGIDAAIKGTSQIGFRCVMEVAKARIYAKVKAPTP